MVGTIAYMSPEQARGETVDHRTDIWSFGVLLYEVCVCALPFASNYDQAVIYGILHENPKPLRSHYPDIPEALEQICAVAWPRPRQTGTKQWKNVWRT